MSLQEGRGVGVERRRLHMLHTCPDASARECQGVVVSAREGREGQVSDPLETTIALYS